MEETPPFLAEYAKSSRAGCKGCSTNICKDNLRIAEMIQSPHFDGKVPNWFHPSCFFKKRTIHSTADVGGFDSLKWKDQETIQSKILSEDGTTLATQGKQTVAVNHDFKAEYAKSNRSSCQGCEEKIEKNVLRLGHMEDSTETASSRVFNKVPRWYHVDCFMENREKLVATSLLANNIEGFKSLKKDDKVLLEDQLGKVAVVSGKRGKGSSGAPPAKRSKEVQTELDLLKAQNDRIWSFIDILKNNLNKSEMVGLLEDNSQYVPIGEQPVLTSLSDAILFGALTTCPDCNGDKLTFSTQGYYHCKGSISEWSKCIYTTKEPKRRKFHLPDEVKDIPAMKALKLSKIEHRLFPKLTAVAASQSSSSLTSQESMDLTNSLPLSGFSVCIVGNLERKMVEIKDDLRSLGAEIVDSVSPQTSIIISNEKELSKKSTNIKVAEKHSIPVVSIDFIEDAKKGDAVTKVISQKISDWGAMPQTIGKSSIIKRSKAIKSVEKSVPKLTKMKLKGGGAIDPESGHDHDCHIYKGDVLYNATLGLVDLTRGSNSYYKLQLLEHDSKSRYYIFRAWGRVGTSVGGNKLDTYHSTHNAISEFSELYYQKTGNTWGTKFSKIPGKFYPLEIDYGEEELPNLTQVGSKSKLEPAIQEIIRMIFDVNAMKQSLLEMEIDLNKMPLGKLSKNQIKEAYLVLKELELMFQSGSDITTHKGKFLDFSNKFFTLIPHDYGFETPPILSTAKIIKEKSEMLDTLLELEISYSILSGGAKTEEETDPMDIYYQKLQADLTVVDNKSDEYDMIAEFVKNTHGSTHSSYDLELLELFKLKRNGEEKRFKPFKQLHNRQLLWHGSRTTNYGGIISQGLRIAPPEAPVTGYMFGKGIYFADMVSKSANYCNATPSAPIGLMLLCEVALGNMYELTAANCIKKLPGGYHSTKGVGRTAPDPAGFRTTADGVDIPMGVSSNSYSGSSSLLYNEFIVYDEAQVKMSYLLKMNFKYKTGLF